MVDIQLDLETLGTEPGDVVISIGALVFDPRPSMIPMQPTAPAPERSFYRNIDIFSSLMAGLKIKDNTVEWWQKQSIEAQEALMITPLHLISVIDDFNKWFSTIAEGNNDNVNVWAKSPNFDCAVWEAACKAVDLSVPWNFRNLRDVRTAVAMAGIDEKKWTYPGTKHNAIDDCRSQARAVTEAHKAVIMLPGTSYQPLPGNPSMSPAPEPLGKKEARDLIARRNRD